MRFITVTSHRSDYGVASNFRGDHLNFAFPVVLMDQHERLRFRSAQFGDGILVCLRLNELDNIAALHPSNAALQPHESMYILVGSDEGLTETTLFRIASLVHEVCLLLNVRGQTWFPNREALQRFLWYIDQRMALNDLGFLSLSLESSQVAVLATGRNSDPNGLIDELVNRMHRELSESEQAPGYAACLFGDKLIMRTNERLAEEACQMNEVENYTLEDADRYLLHLVTAAYFAAPVASFSEVEELLKKCESRLAMFKINRTNALRDASAALVRRYCAMLRQSKGGNPPEDDTADYYAEAFETLKQIVQGKFASLYHLPSCAPPPPPPAANASSVSSSSSPPATVVVSRREPEYILLDQVGLRTGTGLAKCHLLWAPIPEQHGEMSALSSRIPHGYSLCLVYYPAYTDRDHERLQQYEPVQGDKLENLIQAVSANLEHVYNSVCWLLHPPVESYKTPGLMCFVRVDRRTNTAVISSFEEMSDRKPYEVKLAVAELKRTMAQCMSKSHDLLSRGYSEGIWGNLAMQFYYSVGVLDTTVGAGNATGLGGGGRADGQGGAGLAGGAAGSSGATASGTGAGAGGTSGADVSKKLPDRVLEHIVHRPMMIADVARNVPIVELYCMFLGCMSPAEVCAAAETLHSRLLSDKN